jgi:hypothetical protein
MVAYFIIDRISAWHLMAWHDQHHIQWLSFLHPDFPHSDPFLQVPQLQVTVKAIKDYDVPVDVEALSSSSSSMSVT